MVIAIATGSHNGLRAQENTERVRHYREMAMKGSVPHQFNLGLFYRYGTDAKQNYVEAMKWFRMAAAQGDGMSKKNLGDHYYSGLGVPQNYTEAAKWYSEAGNCEDNVGDCHLAAKKYSEAVEWYRKGAERNNAMAKYRLGWCYDNGMGVEKNRSEAVKWYNEYNRSQGRPEITESGAPIASLPSPTPPATLKPETAKSPGTMPTNSMGVQMVTENGIWKVPVQINGIISLKFVIDSGASEVQISKDVFLTLIRAEAVQEKDFLPGKTFVLADGREVRSNRFIVRSLKVGDATFSNIEAVVGELTAPLLLGQSFLSKVSEWKIDNKNKKLILSE